MTRAGEQRYRCLACGRTFTRFSGRVGNFIRKRFAFETYLAAMYEARPVRKDADKLGVAPSTIWRWRHQVMRVFAERRSKEHLRWEGAAVAMTRFIGKRRRLWGVAYEGKWMDRRGLAGQWQKEYGRGENGLMVHFVAETRQDNQAPQLTIEIGTGSILYPCIPKPFVTKVPSRPDYWEFGGINYYPISYQATPRDIALLRQQPMMSPIRLWNLRRKKQLPERFVSRTMHKAANKARKLSNFFLSWSRRFRGLALKYLERYVAWFFYDLRSQRLKVPDWYLASPCANWARAQSHYDVQVS